MLRSGWLLPLRSLISFAISADMAGAARGIVERIARSANRLGVEAERYHLSSMVGGAGTEGGVPSAGEGAPVQRSDGFERAVRVEGVADEVVYFVTAWLRGQGRIMSSPWR